MVLGVTGRWPDAVLHLERVVEALSENGEALYWMALAKKHTGKPLDAVSYCEAALRSSPRNPAIWNELGLCQTTLNQNELACQAFQQAARFDQNKAVYHFNSGVALCCLNRIHRAQEAFEESIRLDPHHLESYFELANILEVKGKSKEVIEVLSRGVDANPSNSRLLTTLAGAIANGGDPSAAEQTYRMAMAANPESGNAFGLWLQEEGRFGEAVEAFTGSIGANPIQGIAYYGLVQAKVFEVGGRSIIDVAVPILESIPLDGNERTYLLYAIAKAYEHLRDFKSAIDYFNQANEAAFSQFNTSRPFDRERLTKSTNETISNFPGPIAGQRRGSEKSEVHPIFIVGMIRSGTTLLDQIISRHLDVKSAGEPVFWLREADRLGLSAGRISATEAERLARKYLDSIDALVGDTRFFTDKMPLNYWNLGLIRQVFPQAKFIHCRRNAMDTSISIYTTFFGKGPPFLYNQSNIAFYYREYLRLMAHWRGVLPDEFFIEVDYESLIGDTESIARKVVSFCGLSWDDSCLDYERIGGSIKTPSNWQARQPIYSSSIGRWKDYKEWLGDLIELNGINHAVESA